MQDAELVGGIAQDPFGIAGEKWRQALRDGGPVKGRDYKEVNINGRIGRVYAEHYENEVANGRRGGQPKDYGY